MKPKQFLIGLAVLSLLILTPALFRANSAPAPEVAPVIRARGLELVDDHGRLRAELKVFPAQPALKMPDGTTGFPESVVFRLIDSKGGPNIKLTTTEDGSGVVVGSESGYVQIITRGTNLPVVKLVAKDGREQVMKLP